MSEQDAGNIVLSIRLRGAEAARYQSLLDSAKAGNAYIDKSDVIRELLGLSEPKLLSPHEIALFCYPTRRVGRDETERGRTIRIAQWLWDSLDRDAERCRRSSVKQLEAILAAYFGEDGAEIDHSRLQDLADRFL